MLKKGQPVKFTRPVSTMRTVLASVENGYQYRHDIVDETGLKLGQVSAALYNLTFIGCITRMMDDNGRSVYMSPGRLYGSSDCFKGVNSVFSVPLPKGKIWLSP